MPLITITETGRVTDTPNATVSIDHGTPHPITITPPFSDADDVRLRWYFEEHLRFPFTQQVRARQAAESIVTYGEALFMQVFKSTPEIYAAYQAAVRGGLQTLHFDIVGSPTFHQRHWEALREPGRDPFVLHAPMVRRTQTALQSPMAMQALADDPPAGGDRPPAGPPGCGLPHHLPPPDRRAAPGAGAGAGGSGAAGDVSGAGRTPAAQPADPRRRLLSHGALRSARGCADVSGPGPGGWGEPPHLSAAVDGPVRPAGSGATGGGRRGRPQSVFVFRSRHGGGARPGGGR